MSNMVFRVQDRDGRGPYKPGFSHKWQEYRCLIPDPGKATFMDEFPGSEESIKTKFSKDGGHFGCAFRTMEQLKNWFTEYHINKLIGYGYKIVKFEPDEVLYESNNQMVVWMKRPLKNYFKKSQS